MAIVAEPDAHNVLSIRRIAVKLKFPLTNHAAWYDVNITHPHRHPLKPSGRKRAGEKYGDGNAHSQKRPILMPIPGRFMHRYDQSPPETISAIARIGPQFPVLRFSFL
jgi:hypothetical protein